MQLGADGGRRAELVHQAGRGAGRGPADGVGDFGEDALASGTDIRLSPHLAGHDLRADVLASLAVAAVMVASAEDASPGDIAAPCGFVVILREGDPDPASPAGKCATAIARVCGRGAAPAAFSYYVPVLADDAPDGAR